MSLICCNRKKAGWKREEFPDHKFTFLDMEDFRDPSCTRQTFYFSVFLFTLKSIVVYVADLWTMVMLMLDPLYYGKTFEALDSGRCVPMNTAPVDGESRNTFQQILPVPFEYRKYIVLASIVVSFLLLLVDMYKAQKIVKSRDISFALTSTIANRYYAMKSYPHYCLFTRIRKTSKNINRIAFFVFFTLRGWKRLIFAETPRRIFSLFTLIEFYTLFNVTGPLDIFRVWSSIIRCDDTSTVILIILFTFVVVVWLWNVFTTVLAAVFYVPLACKIRGNLKEYCCHLIDKRISEILRKQTRKRMERQSSSLKKPRTGEDGVSGGGKLRGFVGPHSPTDCEAQGSEPTLPTIDFPATRSDCGDSDVASLYSNHYSSRSTPNLYMSSQPGGAVPPIPSHYQSPHSFHHFAQSSQPSSTTPSPNTSSTTLHILPHSASSSSLSAQQYSRFNRSNGQITSPPSSYYIQGAPPVPPPHQRQYQQQQQHY